MTTISTAQRGIPVDQLGPALSLGDVMKEAESLPAEITDLGNGVSVERRGPIIKLHGGEKLSPAAMRAAFQASDIGGEAGRAMFDTFRRNNPAEFDGSRTFAAILGMADGPRSAPPATNEAAAAGAVAGASSARVTGSAEADFLEVLHSATVWGLGGNDVIRGGDECVLDGGDGDDHLEAYHRSTLIGGAGNDRLEAYNDAVLDGGAGDDAMTAYHGASVTDSGGDNYVSVYGDAAIATGAGNDWIEAYDDGRVVTGDGANRVSVGNRSTVTGGAGVDYVTAGIGATVSSGDGDDRLVVGRGSTVAAGRGDDRITVDGGAYVSFARGDGNDILDGGAWGQAYRETDRLSSTTLAFGAGISAADLLIRRQGNDMVIDVGAGDSVTLKDVQRHGVPGLTFADGTAISAAELDALAGPAAEYRPASRLVQDWVNASAAYQASRGQGGTTATASA